MRGSEESDLGPYVARVHRLKRRFRLGHRSGALPGSAANLALPTTLGGGQRRIVRGLERDGFICPSTSEGDIALPPPNFGRLRVDNCRDEGCSKARMPNKGTIRVSSACHIADFVRTLGGSPERVFRAAGVVPAEVDSPDRWLEAERLGGLFEAGALELDDPWFGVRFGLEAPIEDFGVVAYVVLNAPLVRTAIENLRRYAREYSYGPIEKASIEVFGDVAEIAFRTPTAMGDRVRHLLECHFTSIARTLRRLVASDSVVSEVCFQHLNLAGRSEVCSEFDVAFRFGANANAVRFESSALQLPVVGADRSLLPVVRTRLADLRGAAGVDFPSRVGGEIAAMLCDGPPHVGKVARNLAMSPRSLQRRLAEHGTSFREVLGSIRVEMAEEYLSGSDLQVSEIAALLGYAEPSSFTHAFRAARGLSPKDWRCRRSR